MKGWRIGTMDTHWLLQPKGDVAGLVDRFARVFDYEEFYGRLWLTKSACLEELDEYVQERGAEREPLVRWIDSLPWEMDEHTDDEDGTLALVVEWDRGDGSFDDGKGIVVSASDGRERWRRWIHRIRNFLMRPGVKN